MDLDGGRLAGAVGTQQGEHRCRVATSMSMSSRTRRSPYDLRRPVTLIAGAPPLAVMTGTAAFRAKRQMSISSTKGCLTELATISKSSAGM